MRYYVAYGSNMWDEQMRMRCPQSKKIGAARLAVYRFIITTRGYANVVASREHEVEGVLMPTSSRLRSAIPRKK